MRPALLRTGYLPDEEVRPHAVRLVRRCVAGLRDAAALLITPARCRTCSLPLLRADAYPVCADCLARLAPPKFSLCWLCSDALSIDEEHAAGLVHRESLRCAACALREPPYARAVCFGSYRGVLRHLIHLFKFEGVRSLAAPLGARLAQSLAALLEDRAASAPDETFTVIAVPLYRGKRGFNQSELLADEAVRLLRSTHPALRLETGHALLRRTRATESQSHLTPRQRTNNVRNAFQCGAGVLGRQVLLVDDVLTTGATASECATELLRSGAAGVHVVTLARAHRRDAVPFHQDAPVGAWTAWESERFSQAAVRFRSTEKEV